MGLAYLLFIYTVSGYRTSPNWETYLFDVLIFTMAWSGLNSIIIAILRFNSYTYFLTVGTLFMLVFSILLSFTLRSGFPNYFTFALPITLVFFYFTARGYKRLNVFVEPDRKIIGYVFLLSILFIWTTFLGVNLLGFKSHGMYYIYNPITLFYFPMSMTILSFVVFGWFYCYRHLERIWSFISIIWTVVIVLILFFLIFARGIVWQWATAYSGATDYWDFFSFVYSWSFSIPVFSSLILGNLLFLNIRKYWDYK